MTAYPPVDGTQPCASGYTDRWFPHHNTTAKSAAQVTAECLPCPFKAPCLAYALTHNVDGIWAGTTENERRAIRRKRGIVAEPLMVHSLVGITHGPRVKGQAS